MLADDCVLPFCQRHLTAPQANNGFFTAALLARLRESGHFEDVRRLMGHVRAAVGASTDNQQRPWVNEALPPHDVVVLPRPASVREHPSFLFFMFRAWLRGPGGAVLSCVSRMVLLLCMPPGWCWCCCWWGREQASL